MFNKRYYSIAKGNISILWNTITSNTKKISNFCYNIGMTWKLQFIFISLSFSRILLVVMFCNKYRSFPKSLSMRRFWLYWFGLVKTIERQRRKWSKWRLRCSPLWCMQECIIHKRFFTLLYQYDMKTVDVANCRIR